MKHQPNKRQAHEIERGSSFPYLEKLAETSICNREHHSSTGRSKTRNTMEQNSSKITTKP